jgi:hypothetical protein
MANSSRFLTREIVWELVEFSKDILQDIQSQLIYYKAVTEKEHVGTKLTRLFSQFKSLSQIINHSALIELVDDCEYLLAATDSYVVSPGETSQSVALMHLSRSAMPLLQTIQSMCVRQNNPVDQAMLNALRQHKHELLRVCRHGTRSWELLRSLSKF